MLPSMPVTVSMLPPLERFVEELRDIWASHRLTNAGPKVQAFETALRQTLGTENCLTFCNGGAALMAGIAALKLEGEVLTTPFTFPGTTHSLAVNGLTPVFCDIDPVTYNLSPSALEAAITPRTSAILGVHVFGHPCEVEAIDEIARRRGLKVIYDGAHAYGATAGGRSVAAYGDVQMFSFNATKLLTTGEGGCVVYKDAALGEDLRRIRRWGMLEEGDVTMPGVNGMLSEIHAALGLCNLEQIAEERRLRQIVVTAYGERLKALEGVVLPVGTGQEVSALSYFVIRITPAFGRGRDTVLEKLREHGILARRYFYPLCSRLPCYRHLPGAQPGATPVADQIADEVLSLPLYGSLGERGVDYICTVLETLHSSTR